MLAAAQRLRRREDFSAAVRAGRRAGRGVLVVHLSLGPTMADHPARVGESAPTRAGFVIPKAVGIAVVRNRVRRRLRHLVRERLGSLPPGSTLVVRALPGSADRSYTELADDLDGALAAARTRQRSRGQAVGE